MLPKDDGMVPLDKQCSEADVKRLKEKGDDDEFDDETGVKVCMSSTNSAHNEVTEDGEKKEKEEEGGQEELEVTEGIGAKKKKSYRKSSLNGLKTLLKDTRSKLVERSLNAKKSIQTAVIVHGKSLLERTKFAIKNSASKHLAILLDIIDHIETAPDWSHVKHIVIRGEGHGAAVACRIGQMEESPSAMLGAISLVHPMNLRIPVDISKIKNCSIHITLAGNEPHVPATNLCKIRKAFDTMKESTPNNIFTLVQFEGTEHGFCQRCDRNYLFKAKQEEAFQSALSFLELVFVARNEDNSKEEGLEVLLDEGVVVVASERDGGSHEQHQHHQQQQKSSQHVEATGGEKRTDVDLDTDLPDLIALANDSRIIEQQVPTHIAPHLHSATVGASVALTNYSDLSKQWE